jgi:alkylhydroperoxidase family enzyme
MHDYRNGNWDAKTRAMLDYSSQLTRDPQSMTKADFESLKEKGLTEDEILATVRVRVHDATGRRAWRGANRGSAGVG